MKTPRPSPWGSYSARAMTTTLVPGRLRLTMRAEATPCGLPDPNSTRVTKTRTREAASIASSAASDHRSQLPQGMPHVTQSPRGRGSLAHYERPVRCPGAESNHRHCDFQSHALPTELPGRRAVAHSSCPGADQADSAGGSSSVSSCGAGIRYCPVSQRPRSTSAQRRLQNGRNSSTAGLPQIGHDGTDRLGSTMLRLKCPPRCRKGGIRPHNQGTPGATCKIRQGFGIGLQCGHDARRRTQHGHPLRL
jgi:hypothetical protein